MGRAVGRCHAVAGGIVIALTRLNRIHEVDIPNRRVTVGPG
jgi:FAD/FMN-containing dehydrogenase